MASDPVLPFAHDYAYKPPSMALPYHIDKFKSIHMVKLKKHASHWPAKLNLLSFLHGLNLSLADFSFDFSEWEFRVSRHEFRVFKNTRIPFVRKMTIFVWNEAHHFAPLCIPKYTPTQKTPPKNTQISIFYIFCETFEIHFQPFRP